MSTSTSKKTLMAIDVDGDVIVVRSAYDSSVVSFMRGHRYDAQRGGWIVGSTPENARWLLRCPLDGVFVRATRAVEELACSAPDPQEVDYETQPERRKVDLWRHQVGAHNFAVGRDDALLAMGMGTGKSLCTVALSDTQQWRRTLVLCPTSVMGVWRREFAKWSVDDVDVLVLDRKRWNNARQAKEAEQFLAMCNTRGVRAVVVQNYEAAWRPQFSRFALKAQWDAVVCDESHRIAKPHSKVGKFAAKLGKVAGKRLCLTGTPLSHSPLDIFGQARFLNPQYFGESWARFRGAYAVTGHFGADHIVDYKDLDVLASIMDQFTYQVDSSVLDLPEVQHIDLTAELPSKAARAYRALEQEMIAEVEGGTITVANGLVKLLRLQQMTSGYAVTEGGDLVQIDDGKQRLLSELLVDIDTSADPVVVFCRFREDLRRIEETCEKLGRAYGEISGSRRDLTPQATMPEGVEVMGVQIQSGGTGIDLTRARYGVYYSVGYSLTDFDQSVARIHRPGQDRPVTYYHLVMRDTVDVTVYKALSKRRDLVESVIDRLKGYDTEQHNPST